MGYGRIFEPRIVGIFNLILLGFTTWALVFCASFYQLLLCRGATAAGILVLLFGWLGHIVFTMYLSFETILYNTYPWNMKQLPSHKVRSGESKPSVEFKPLQEESESLLGNSKILTSTPRKCTPAKAFKITLGTLSIVSILFIYIMACIGQWLRFHTVSPASGKFSAKSLTKPTSITRTSTGLIRIDATTEYDLYFTQGVAHAQTRMWQLEFQRRVGAGRLSEVVGEGGLDTDKLMRTLNVYDIAARDYANMPSGSPAKNAIDAYVDGVNYFMGTIRSNGFMPLEVRALGIELEPWTATDTLVWVKIMSWDLAGNLDMELLRYNLLVGQNLTASRISTLYPPFDTNRFPTVLSMADLGNLTNRNNQFVGVEIPKNLIPEDLAASYVAEAHNYRKNGGDASNIKVQPAPHSPLSELESKIKITSSLRSAEKAAQVAVDKAISEYKETEYAVHFSMNAIHYLGVVGNYGLEAIEGVKSIFGYSDSDPWLEHSVSAPATLGRGTFKRDKRIGASNNWVISGNLTASGYPILANDPHLQLLAPSLWQLTHLSCLTCGNGGIEVIGASFAGIPCVVIGHNENIAWGVTNTGADVQDLYIMTDNPSNSSEYLMNGQYVPYDVRTEVITVKGAPAHVMTVRTSVFGPVVTDNDVETSNGLPLSMRWVAIDPAFIDTTFESFYSLNRASNYTSFRQALSMWASPSQNVIYADVEGNIAYQMPGTIPLRNLTIGHTGAYPVPGNTMEYQWVGIWDFDDLPRTLNPVEGFIATANNQVVPNAWVGQGIITMDWDAGSDGYRALRISTMIKEAAGISSSNPTGLHSITVEDVIKIQQDTVSFFSRDVTALLTSPLFPAAVLNPNAGVRALINTFALWDFNQAKYAALPTLFADFFVRLSQLAAKETGQSSWANAVYLLNILQNELNGTGTDPNCATAGSCAGAFVNALDATYKRFKLETMQVTVNNTSVSVISTDSLSKVPQWGLDVHQLTITHEVLSQSPLSCLADRTIVHGGDHFTVNVGSYPMNAASDGGATKVPQTTGPSYRQIITMSPSASFTDANSAFIIPGGADGAPFSWQEGQDFGFNRTMPPSVQKGFYMNMLDYWQYGFYLQMSMTADASSVSGGDIISLSP